MSWLPSVRAADQSAPSDIRFASRRCPRRHRWAVAGLAIILATPARPCTTLFLRNAENRIVGNNYDYYAVDGRVIVNRRGLRKAVYSTNSGLQWVSRFGSVTFNQWGHEFPNGGLNEAGLVVEQMMLDGTQYPIDGRPSITEMQWIQYQLDCSATVQDVVASDAGIRIHQDSTPLHFFVADAAGNAAVIEFLGGRLVAHTGDSLPIPALTNHTYEASLAYASITRPEQADHVSSLGRFVQAATSAATFAQSPVTDPVGFALAALDNVNQPNWTRWSTVCDIGRRRVYFRTQAARAIKQIALADLDFRPEATTRMLDINTTAPGVVVPDWPISRADNLAVLTSVFRQTTPLASTPLSYLQQRAAYPDSIVIEPRPPAITSHPASQTVAPGGHAVLSVTANGDAPPFAYQWSRNGIAITGATAPLLSLTSVTSADAADYAVTVTSAVGSTTSRFARLVVASPEPGRLINLSARATAGVAGEPLIVGLVVSGGTRKVLVRAIGPSLRTLFGVDGVLADPRLEVHRSVDGQDQMLAANDNWAATPEERDSLATTFARVGAFAVPATSRDAAVVADVDGARTFHACAVPASDRGVVLVEVYDAGTGDSPRLINLSTRNQVGTGDDVLVAGFVVNGNMPKRLLVRGVGPSLASGFGVTDALPDARLELHTTIDGRDTIVASNDDWTDEPGAAEAAASAGAFALPANSKDATLVVTVPAGAYTAIVSGAYGLTGNGLVEIYELP